MATTVTYTLLELFEKFSKSADPKTDGKRIALSQSDKWMKQAGVLGKKITTTDTGVAFCKFKTRTINFADYEKFLQDLAKTKSVEYSEITTKMTTCGIPEDQVVVGKTKQAR